MRWDTKQDRKFRESLERRSIDEGRANITEALNKVAAGDALGQPGLSAYLLLQAAQRTHGQEIRRLNKAHDAYLAKARGATQDRSDPGPDPAYSDSFTPKLKADKVPAEGSIKGNAREYEPKGDGARPIEPTFMTVEQMRVVAGVKALMSRYF
jgi:hypothetical protein